MRTAIPVFDGRVSSVFDFARHLLVVDIENGREAGRFEQPMDEPEPNQRARRVAQLGVDVLICGAISRPLEAMLSSAGVEVIPQTSGPVEDVLRAFISGKLTERAFVMPGCRGHRRNLPTGHSTRYPKTAKGTDDGAVS